VPPPCPLPRPDCPTRASSQNESRSTIERKLREYRAYRTALLGGVALNVDIPASPSREWLDFLVVDCDDAIIIGDVEVPDHSPTVLYLALLDGIANNIRTLIVNGDFIATDQTALNTWKTRWKDDKEATYEQSRDLVVHILDEMAKWFTKIIIIEGNHDYRIAKATGGEVHLGMFIPRDLTQVRYSRYPYLYLQTSRRGLVKCVHPESFSSTPVALAQSFYDAERGPYFDPLRPFESIQKCHFVVSHTHIDQSGYSKDGVFEMHAIGTCREPARTQYKSTAQNKHHQWSPSFLRMKGGYFTHLHVWGTDWQQELGGLYEYSPFTGGIGEALPSVRRRELEISA